jgi:hypothetical protein
VQHLVFQAPQDKHPVLVLRMRSVQVYSLLPQVLPLELVLRLLSVSL